MGKFDGWNCSLRTWTYLIVQDDDSGLHSIKVTPAGKETYASQVYYRYLNKCKVIVCDSNVVGIICRHVHVLFLDVSLYGEIDIYSSFLLDLYFILLNNNCLYIKKLKNKWKEFIGEHLLSKKVWFT